MPSTLLPSTLAPQSAQLLLDQNRQSRNQHPLLSLVIPVMDEQDSIAPFLTAIDDALAYDVQNGLRLEVIFVNDGSRDETLFVLYQTAEQRDNAKGQIRILDLSRNFGKEAALCAGLDATQGDIVVPMDVDLQDPPTLIPEMLAKWRGGYDVVLAQRVDRSSDTAFKSVSAETFYRIYNKVSSQKLPHNVGDFRLMDRKVVKALGHLTERTRFMKGLMSWVGFVSATVPYSRPARSAGTTSFNALKLIRLALDGIMSFSVAPLRFILILGVVFTAIAVLYSLFLVLRTLLFGIDVEGYASTIVIMLAFFAVQLTTLGIVGEYIARVYQEVKHRPMYIVANERTPAPETGAHSKAHPSPNSDPSPEP